MKKDVDYIYLLMTAKVAGVISAEEAAWLDELISKDETVKARWEEFREQYSPERVNNTFQRYEQEWIAADDITAIPSQTKPPAYKKYRRAAAAALALGGICMGIYLFSTRMQPRQEITLANNTKTPGNNKQITLQMAGGKIVSLSATIDSISVAGARLASSNKTLSYTAAGSEAAILNTLTVPVGMDYHVNLSDGSEVWLNSATRLQFPFTFNGPAREIFINGEAYVKAAPNASLPFLVHTPRGTVQVLGTEFNVNSYDSGTVKVALVSGAIRFQTPGKEVTVKPGTEAVYTENKGIHLQAFDEEDVLAWRSGNYPFTDATLKEIITILPRWFGVEVAIDNPSLNAEHFTGVMSRNQPIQVFLEHLKATTSIRYSFDQAGVLHFQ